MEIKNARRILALGAPDSGVLSLLKDLTGSAPTQVESSTAGLSHSWKLKTSYYTVELPIWIDEIAEVERWKADFMLPEAAEVVRALGAWIYVFRKPVTQVDLETIKSTMRAIADITEKAWGYGWDGVSLAVAMPQSMTPSLQKSLEEWEDLCRQYDFEYVDAEAKGRNEFGGPVGIARLKEAIEANSWAADDVLDTDAVDSIADDGLDKDGTFATEEAEMGMEFAGMKTSINGGDDVRDALHQDEQDDEASQVEELERMMLKMQAIRDMGADMPEVERKKLAAKAVNDLMKTF